MKDLISFIEQASAQWKQEQGKSLEASVLLRGACTAAEAILAKAKELEGTSGESAKVPAAANKAAAPKKPTAPDGP